MTPSPVPPADLWIGPRDIRLHPDGNLYSGDRISFSLTAHNDSHTWLARVPIRIQTGSTDWRIDGAIGSIDPGSSSKTDLDWVWDTQGLSGTLPVTITLDPEHTLTNGDEDRSNDVVVLQVDLKPKDELPAAQRTATWKVATSRCCRLHYITGTAAEHDLANIQRTADEAYDFVSARIDPVTSPPIEVYLIDRVLGQGGLAIDQRVLLSYLDREYSGGEFSQVLRHEFTHALDRARRRGTVPVFLLEGYAVYLTGGHYQVEPVAYRAAALLEANRTIPLRKLIDNFYASQHETAYAEAAAFIKYLADRFGREAFTRFYAGLQPLPGETDVNLIDRALHQSFNFGLDDLERDWQVWLRHQPVTEADRSGIFDSISFYDTVRRYEQTLDPSAYLLSLWTPDLQSAETRGLVADYQRHPRQPENIALETMLVAADHALRASSGDRTSGATLLASVNRVLEDHLQFDDPLAAQYLAVVKATLAKGYEPQQITIIGSVADVWATRSDARLIRLSARLDQDRWLVQLAE